MKIVV